MRSRIRRRRWLHPLFALALLLGQLAAVLHATQHELRDGGLSVACQICAIGHDAGPLPSSASVSPLCLQARVQSLPAVPAVLALGPQRRPPSRGPPMFLA